MKKLIAKKMIVKNLILAIMLSFVTPFTFAQTPIQTSTEQLGIASQKAETLVNQYGVTSVQYALIDNGEIVTSGQAGRYSQFQDKELTNEHMYTIASVSKIYTAAAVMKLVDMGQLELDTPIVKYIKSFKMLDERYKEITPRMLLNHSSGLMASGLENTILLGDIDTSHHDNFLNKLQAEELKFKPGAYSVYCNDGFTLAEILVEHVSEMSFTSFLHKYFTRPLELNNTKTPEDNPDQRNVVRGCLPTYEGELLMEVPNMIGTGGIYATAEEVCRFSEIFMRKNKGILSNKSLIAMEQREYLRGMWAPGENNSLGYGLGWDSVDLYPFNTYGIKALSKSGDLFTGHGSVIVLPDYNMSATVLTSGGSGIINQIVATEMLLERLKEKGIITEIKPYKSGIPPVPSPMPEKLQSYQGIYADYRSTMAVDINKKGILSIGLGIGEPTHNYIYTQEGAFVSEDGAIKIKFHEEENGCQYIWMEEVATISGVGQFMLTHYIAQKVDPNKLAPEVESAWHKRNGKNYYLVNEKYSSETYLMIVEVPFVLNQQIRGYIGPAKILDKNTAKTNVTIPMTMGRDLPDFLFYQKEGIEYLKIRGSIYIREEGVKSFDIHKNNIIKIGENGYAKWYSVPVEYAEQKIKISAPKETNVIVYDKGNNCVYNKYLKGQDSVTLPKDSMIVFIGPPHTQFLIKLQ